MCHDLKQFDYSWFLFWQIKFESLNFIIKSISFLTGLFLRLPFQSQEEPILMGESKKLTFLKYLALRAGTQKRSWFEWIFQLITWTRSSALILNFIVLIPRPQTDLRLRFLLLFGGKSYKIFLSPRARGEIVLRRCLFWLYFPSVMFLVFFFVEVIYFH
jgi:hypothetical protein